jgi:hypothetical protein
MKYHFLYFCLLSIVSFGAGAKDSDQSRTAVAAVLSFEDSYYLLQTDHDFFRVEKSKLAPELRADLDRAVETGDPRGFAIPHQAISYAWPVSPSPESETPFFPQNHSTPSNDRISRHGEEVEVAGTLAISFQESQYIVLSNGKLYLIFKSSLGENVNQRLDKIVPGERVTIKIPGRTLVEAGRFAFPADSNPVAGSAEPEGIKTRGRHLTIRGVVLHSFNDAFVVLRANQNYFQLDRARIEVPIRGNLNLPGSFVKVRAPLEAVKFIWTIPANENRPSVRAPAADANH